jgi:hypothetical protein
MGQLGLDEATKSMEGLLLPKRIEGKVRLKNGSEVDAQKAYVSWRFLQAFTMTEPAEMRALLALAHGEDWLVSTETKDRLRVDRTWFDKNGTLEPHVKDVLLSGWRDTADGPVMVDPFQLTTQAEVDLIARIERQSERFWRSLIRRGKSPPGPSIP